MFSFQQKRQLKKVFTSRAIHVVLLIVCIAVGWSAYGRYKITQEMAQGRARAEAEVVELQKRKAELEERVNYITNERGIEAEMRRQFDIARDGEQVVIILDKEAETPQ